MSSIHESYLTPDDLAMLHRALTRIQNSLKLDKVSEESNLLAARMIAEFQKSSLAEDEIVWTFLSAARRRNKRRAIF